MRVIVTLAATVVIATSGCSGPADPPQSDGSGSPPAPVVPHSYQSDVANTVILAVRRGDTDEDLLQQVGIVAKRHGLDDWTSLEKTYAAIGAGLRKADADADRAGSVARLVGGSDAARARLVLEAYGE